jgi:hypothetical protein
VHSINIILFKKCIRFCKTGTLWQSFTFYYWLHFMSSMSAHRQVYFYHVFFMTGSVWLEQTCARAEDRPHNGPSFVLTGLSEKYRPVTNNRGGV